MATRESVLISCRRSHDATQLLLVFLLLLHKRKGGRKVGELLERQSERESE